MREMTNEQMISDTEASMKMEGMLLSDENKKLMEKCLKKEISYEEAIRMMVLKHKRKAGHR
jgi:hypothetical protein